MGEIVSENLPAIINEWNIKWVPIESLKPNPENPNEHSEEQINELIQSINFYGWKHPIIVSNQSGFIVVGEGRYLAAKKMGAAVVPVHFQDFESYDVEYGFMCADNGLGQQSKINMGKVNAKIPDLHLPTLGLLGIKGLQMDPPNFSPAGEGEQGKLDQKNPIQCPACGHEFIK